MSSPEKPLPFCQVAVALPVHGAFTYSIPEDLQGRIAPGHRVLVPFGRRRITGYVLDLQSECSLDTVKPILEKMDDEPAFDSVRGALFTFIADYYQQNLGEVIKTGLPAGINRASKIVWSITPQGLEAVNTPGLPMAERRVLMCMEPEVVFSQKQLAARCDAATPLQLSRLLEKDRVRKQDLLEKEATRARFQTLYFISTGVDPDSALDQLSRAPKQAEVFRFLTQACEADATALQAAIPHYRAGLTALVGRGLVDSRQEESYRTVDCGYVENEGTSIVLNKHQQKALDAIAPTITTDDFSPFLIHGVTGSGKTEVYLRLAALALKEKKTVLVLVPEIALTPQLVSRFVRRFGQRIAISHSGLSGPERFDQWRQMQSGQADLCVGTRSALFAPLANLGLVVVDEEHDTSYKQDEGVPYNARDLSMVLGKNIGATVVLGSATPSLESYQSAKTGRYRLLELPERATEGTLPEVEVIDLGKELALARRSSNPVDQTDPDSSKEKSLPSAKYAITPLMKEAIRQTLEAGDQTILFLNRRGFSSHAFCLECRRSIMCPNCSVTLTAHNKGRELRCHYCDHRQLANVVCEHCGGRNFFLAGIGTQQVETILCEQFPKARVARLDRDSVARKGMLEKILSAFSQRQYDILVGTQIVTKGHDFPGVTLVGVLSADVGMNLPDFRCAERSFQLLSQVAGRSGRGDRTGRVLVQTFNPEHYAIKAACKHDFKSFQKQEAKGRKESGYPPFARVALMHARSKNAESARSFLLMIANQLRRHLRDQDMTEVRVLGPAQSLIPRISGQFRFQVMLKAPTPSTLHAAAALAGRFAGLWKHEKIDWKIDIDPQNLL